MEKWIEAETVATWIIIAVATVVFLTISLVRLFYINLKKQIEIQLKDAAKQIEHQRHLVETSILVQERERNRIAADLHDSLIGKINAVRLINRLEYNTHDVDKLLVETINEARRISHDLKPPLLDFTDLDEIIENTINPWKSYLKISFYKAIFSGGSLSGEMKLQINRIIQELMMNISKHSGASHVEIGLKITKNKIAIILQDNGRGFDFSKASKGLGMRNIELRVSYLNGLYKYKSKSVGMVSIFLFSY